MNRGRLSLPPTNASAAPVAASSLRATAAAGCGACTVTACLFCFVFAPFRPAPLCWPCISLPPPTSRAPPRFCCSPPPPPGTTPPRFFSTATVCLRRVTRRTTVSTWTRQLRSKAALTRVYMAAWLAGGRWKGGEGGCGRGILLRLVVVGEFADVACRTKAHMSSSADGASGCGLPTSADPVEGHGGSGGAAACPWLGPGAGRAHVGWWLRLLPPTGAVGGRRVDPAPPPPLPLSVFPAQVPSGWPWLLPPTSRAPARVPVPAIATMGRLRCVRGHRRRM